MKSLLDEMGITVPYLRWRLARANARQWRAWREDPVKAVLGMSRDAQRMHGYFQGFLFAVLVGMLFVEYGFLLSAFCFCAIAQGTGKKWLGLDIRPEGRGYVEMYVQSNRLFHSPAHMDRLSAGHAHMELERAVPKASGGDKPNRL